MENIADSPGYTANLRSMGLTRKQIRRHKFRERIARLRFALRPSRYYSEVLDCFNPKHSAGWVVTGLCPFHDNRWPGSLALHMEKGCFHCFSCGASGQDIVAFHAKLHQMNMRDALAQLERCA